ncbi:hypothetical protein ACQKF6_17990, partial [Bacillus velezensis]
MNLFVLMKRTFDTEEKIVIEAGKIQEDGAEFIINPYDEYAIEEAIQLKEEHGGTVTASNSLAALGGFWIAWLQSE